MLVVGISGRAGAGKDTLHLMLKTLLEQNARKRTTKISFADKLKDFCCEMFYWDRDRLDFDSAYKESNLLDDGTVDPACRMLGMNRREVMQRVGTEAIRNGLHRDSWVITTSLDILNGRYAEFDYGFVTDCRFINEIEFVRRHGGVMIRIERTDRATMTDRVQHASETEWQQYADWDAVISNDGTPEGLRREVDKLRPMLLNEW